MDTPKYDDTQPVQEEAPKYEDTSVHPIYEDPTSIGDLAKSVGQGVAFGFGDELLGGAQATKDVLSGNSKLSDLYSQYRKHQQANEQEYEDVKKRSPLLSLVGELGGSVLPAIATGGLSEAGSLASAIRSGARLPTIINEAIPLIKTGAKIGALGGLGGSRANIENPVELGKDVITGAAVGGTLGPLTEAGFAKGGKSIGNFVEDSPILRQHFKAFREGLKGRGFTGDKNLSNLVQESDTVAGDLADKMKAGKDYINQQYGSVLKGDINFTPEEASIFDDLATIISSKKNKTKLDQNTIETINGIKAGSPVSAQDVKNLQKFARDNAMSINQGEDAQTLIQTASSVNDLLKSKVPGYREVNDLFRKFEEPVESFLTNVPSEQLAVASQPNKDTLSTNLFKSGKNVLEKSSLPFQEGKKEFTQLGRLQEGLTDLSTSQPELLKQMGIDNVGNYFNKLKDSADIQAIGKTIGGSGSLNKSIDILGTGLKGTYSAANIAGKVAKGPADLGKAVFGASDDALMSMASKFKGSTNPSTMAIGTGLEKAIQNKSTNSKNAILFTIMQKPDLRALIFPSQENGNEQ